jgi:hypothetical protein
MTNSILYGFVYDNKLYYIRLCQHILYESFIAIEKVGLLLCKELFQLYTHAEIIHLLLERNESSPLKIKKENNEIIMQYTLNLYDKKVPTIQKYIETYPDRCKIARFQDVLHNGGRCVELIHKCREKDVDKVWDYESYYNQFFTSKFNYPYLDIRSIVINLDTNEYISITNIGMNHYICCEDWYTDTETNNKYCGNYQHCQKIMTCKFKPIIEDESLDNILLYKEQTDEMSKSEVLRNGLLLQYVKNQTDEICKLAVQQNGLALEYVKNKTEEICKLAVQQNGLALKYVHWLFYETEEICKLAVQQNGLALQYVERQTQTKDICKLAVQQNGLALQYVERQTQTEDICKLAVQQNDGALHYVKDEKFRSGYYNLLFTI